MIVVYRAVALLFAVITYAGNFTEPESLRNTVGCGFVALTFAVLSLGRPLPRTPPGRLQRLDERAWAAVKPRRFKP